MLDVDSKDTSTGMSSPPLAFTTHKFLEATKSILNSDGKKQDILRKNIPMGMFFLNISWPYVTMYEMFFINISWPYVTMYEISL